MALKRYSKNNSMAAGAIEMYADVLVVYRVAPAAQYSFLHKKMQEEEEESTMTMMTRIFLVSSFHLGEREREREREREKPVVRLIVVVLLNIDSVMAQLSS
jgi:hypothetical protein